MLSFLSVALAIGSLPSNRAVTKTQEHIKVGMESYGELSLLEKAQHQKFSMFIVQLNSQAGLLHKTEQGGIAMLSFFIWLLGIQLKFLRFA